MLECEYCGELISDNEEFYVLSSSDEYVCTNCLKKETITVYKFKDCDEDLLYEEDVEEYDTLESYIDTSKKLIDEIDSTINIYDKFN